MAFTTSSVRPVSCGSLRGLVGNWTGVVGDAPGTFTVGSTQVYEANFYDQSAVSPTTVPMPYTVAVSGNNSTISINYQKTVNTGKFIIWYS